MAHRNIRNGVQTTNKNGANIIQDKTLDIVKTEQRYTESVDSIHIQANVDINAAGKAKDTTT